MSNSDSSIKARCSGCGTPRSDNAMRCPLCGTLFSLTSGTRTPSAAPPPQKPQSQHVLGKTTPYRPADNPPVTQRLGQVQPEESRRRISDSVIYLWSFTTICLIAAVVFLLVPNRQTAPAPSQTTAIVTEPASVPSAPRQQPSRMGEVAAYIAELGRLDSERRRIQDALTEQITSSVTQGVGKMIDEADRTGKFPSNEEAARSVVPTQSQSGGYVQGLENGMSVMRNILSYLQSHPCPAPCRELVGIYAAWLTNQIEISQASIWNLQNPSYNPMRADPESNRRDRLDLDLHHQLEDAYGRLRGSYPELPERIF